MPATSRPSACNSVTAEKCWRFLRKAGLKRLICWAMASGRLRLLAQRSANQVKQLPLGICVRRRIAAEADALDQVQALDRKVQVVLQVSVQACLLGLRPDHQPGDLHEAELPLEVIEGALQL